MNLENLALNIKKAENGIYYSTTSSAISYPEEGNDNFMQIEEDSFWFKHRNNVIAKSVKKYSAERPFFDIGGGNGFVSKRLQDDGCDVVLVEPGASGAANARTRGIEKVLCSTLGNAGFQKESIDSAGLFDVVEHIEDDAGFLKNIHSYLKNEGLLYLTVPAFNILWSNEDKDAGHYRRYSLKAIRELCRECGFEIVYSSYIFSILPLPIFLFRSIPSKLGLNRNSDDLNKHKKEHRESKGLLSKIINSIWAWELRQVQRSKKIRFGSSCFVIAKKQQ
ncbi:class I SAM-dependent methyltransferase [Poritiphilus flavus]|uniref:Methyltransferase domain-containing protein n=1 Tax=Poritiphilus flavus TaxID=2697053 RepID=A0A6L9EHX4_9FLAO|nr:class I SAM-dependent methyltransferase [Poritiphilus flavus]NAS14088.1 methyltransferase domain-containing protein [Poritiphilus flavus]